jgi:hypothetical protein
MHEGPRLVKWQLVFTKQAQKDAKKLAAAGLRSKVEELLEILRENPFQNPPPTKNWSATWQVRIPAGSTSSIGSSIKCWNRIMSLK